MPISPTYPGVYVQEVPSGVRTITGVSTSIAVFIGRAKQGPLNEPVLCLNFSDFEKNFSSTYAGSDLARAVRLFFQNGGTQCYVMRIADGAGYSNVTLKAQDTVTPVLKVTAKSPGLMGDNIHLAVTYNGLNPESTFNLEVFRLEENSAGVLVKSAVENWTSLTMEPNTSRYAMDVVNQNSDLVELDDLVVPSAVTAPGYSQSGRSIPTASFTAEMRELLFGIKPIAYGTGWSGMTTISTPGTYTGSDPKTFTFTVNDSGTIPTDAVNIDWDDGTGNTGTINIPATYTAGAALDVAEGLQVAFQAGDLTGTETFTVDVGPRSNRFRISVDGGSFVNVEISGLTETHIATSSALQTEIQNKINNTLPPGVSVAVSFPAGPGTNTETMKIASSSGDVKIEPASSNDLAAPMMLGTAQGGLDISRYAQFRPVPNSIVFKIDDWKNFADQLQTAFNIITVNSTHIDLTDTLETAASGSIMHKDGYTPSVSGNCDGVREKWSIIAKAINDLKNSDPTFKWSADVWGSRLAIIPADGGANNQGTIATSGGTPVDIGSYFTTNVRYYSLGTSGSGSYQHQGVSGSDGSKPTLTNYRSAFEILDKEVDLFNLMILPTDQDHSESETKNLWGPASVFCQRRRAFLIMDAPASWDTVQTATDPATGVNSLRIGLVKDHSAIFYPRITINENGLNKNVGPSGAIAGLMARIDGSRGVWKAPAGTEADLRGVVGLEHKFSDGENGVLNPRAINTLRIFPNGIVNWGARTMDGDNDFGSEYKYIPIRRLALFMEESLYRGLKWVVFEPNDEPLWAQIRLNVGAFMHNLFRQGAFQGQKPKDAYFVKCDGETTTQNDRDLGMVNIWVGFAPLKPAEFVILYLQQMAGQIEV